MTIDARALVLSAMAGGAVLMAVGTLLGWWLFETTRPPARLVVLRADPPGEVKYMTDQPPGVARAKEVHP